MFSSVNIHPRKEVNRFIKKHATYYQSYPAGNDKYTEIFEET